MQLLIPGRPRDGNSAIADQGFRPFCSMDFEEIQMTFVNEVVSEADIAKYNLPFAPNTRCYWTRDSDRDYYLWGEILDDFARGYDPEGRFDLFLKNRLLSFALRRGDSSVSFRENPYRIVWNSIMRVQPNDFAGLKPVEVISILKEALTCYGYDGRRNLFATSRIVTFEF